MSVDIGSRSGNSGHISESVMYGILAGLPTAIVIRFQALRADLPAWRDP